MGPFFLREKGGCPSRALFGERCGLSGLAEAMRPYEGDLCYRPTSYEVISEPRSRPMGWKVE
jgi:hypothetical protein